MEDAISRSSGEYRELLKWLDDIESFVDRVDKDFRPSITNERYLSGEEVCQMFNLSKRALQNYRDNRQIPYTSIGGKILYSESEIQKLLMRNLIDPLSL